MENNKGIYNINEMRRALVKARENGNRSAVSESMCNSLGISACYWQDYQATMQKLFEAVVTYCRMKNSPATEVGGADITAARNAIFPIWKELLACGEKDKFDRDLRVSDDDVYNLVGFAQVFVNEANNIDDEDDWVSTKSWASEAYKKFVKKVETDLGIRIAQIDMMSDERRDYLRAENKILQGIRKAKGNIEHLTESKTALQAILGKCKGEEARNIINEQIDDVDKKIKAQEEKISKLNEKYDILTGKVKPEEGKVS